MTDSLLQPATIAVVGSGPAGFYTAESLLQLLPKAHVDVRVHLLEKLPEVKLVEKKFDELLRDPRVTFMGNVNVGDAVGLTALQQQYHAVVFCTGAEHERSLGVPGEQLGRIHSAREYVGWYNGHPTHAPRHFDLDRAEKAVIFGVGNVALDVARILLSAPSILAKTDITSDALAVLMRSAVREVHVVGRRGLAQAAFTTKEVRELTAIPGCIMEIASEDFVLNAASKEEVEKDRAKKRQLDLLQKAVTAARTAPSSSKRLHFHFLRNPRAFLSSDGTNVSAVELEKTTLIGPAGQQSARGTGEVVRLNCDIVFKSIGYRSVPIAGLPFSDKEGVVPNEHGRVRDPSTGQALPGLYVAGWLKRGPSGIVGTNKFDAEDTAAVLAADLAAGRLPLAAPRPGLAPSEINATSYQDWKVIDQEEIRRGEAQGKPREKIVSIEEMLRVAGKGR